MGIDISNLEIENVDMAAEGVEEILRNIYIILTTPKGTVVFDRDFGIDWGILDRPVTIAKSEYTVECIAQIRKYEPRVKVKEINFQNAKIDGYLKPKVVIELV